MERSARVHPTTISALNIRGKRPAGPLLAPLFVFHDVCPYPGTDPGWSVSVKTADGKWNIPRRRPPMVDYQPMS